MRCLECGQVFRDNQRVVPVSRYVVSYRKGGFVRSFGDEYIHLKCPETQPKGS